jgi:hypothetical protein
MRVCACAWCRRSVRTAIEITWEQHPRWMGVFTARYLCCVDSPWPVYRSVFAEMIQLGILIASFETGDDYPRYILSRLTCRAAKPRGGNR